MPPRHAYWTIIVDEQPTSFRAHDVEELLPTFNRLRERHPSAQLRWFERGRLWESREAAREQGFGQGERRWEGSRPARTGEPERREPPRDRKWRPGGEHRDPRQKYKDAKKAKWGRYKTNIRARWEEKQTERLGRDQGDVTPPHGDPMRRRDERAPRSFDRRSSGEPTRPHGDPMRTDKRPDWKRDRKPWGKKPGGGKPSGGFGKRKPFGPRRDGARADSSRRSDDRARGAAPGFAESRSRKPWGSKGRGGFRTKPFGGGPPRGPRPPKPGPKKRRDDEE